MSLPSTIDELIESALALEHAGDIGAAFQRAQQALDQARQLDQAAALAFALNCAAFIQFRLGHYAEARAHASQALACSADDSPAHARAWLILGDCAAETNSLDDAETHYHQAIDLARMASDHRVHMIALHNLSAAIYLPRGQFDLALAADVQACHLARNQNLPELLYMPLITMAWAYQLTGQRTAARETLVELARIGASGSLADGYHQYLQACLALDVDDVAGVPAMLMQARAIAEAIGEPGLNIEVRLALSRYHRMCGNASDASAWAGDALAIATRVGYRHLQGKSLVECGRASWASGDLDAAESRLRSAIEIMLPLRTNLDLTRAHFLLAALLRVRKDSDLKPTWLEAASRMTTGGYAFLLDQERELAFPLIVACISDPLAETVTTMLLAHLQCIPPMPLQIQVLGRFEVRQGKRLITGRAIRQRRADELLGLLLITPGYSLSRDQVIEAMWPEQETATVQVRFHHATSALRKALEPELPDKFPSRYLELEAGQVTLRLPAGSSVDCETFEQLVQQGHWSEAVAQYQGDLLPNILYVDWAIAARESLIQLYLRALLESAQEMLDANRATEALDACRRVLVYEPWQEQAVLLGMRACMLQNNRTGALRLYRKMAATLERDLGVEPQEELQTLYRSLSVTRQIAT